MKYILLLLILLNTLIAEEYALVAHKDLKSLQVSQVRAIYLKKIQFTEDTKLIALNLSPKSKIRKSFEKKVLHMGFGQLQAYWTQQHYLGHRPPKTLKSQKAVVNFVEIVLGTIAYIQSKLLTPNMLTLYKWSDK